MCTINEMIGAAMATFWPLTLACLGCSLLGLVTKWLLRTKLDTGFWFKRNKFRKWALEEGLLNDVGAPYGASDFLEILKKWKIRKLFYQRTLTTDVIKEKYEKLKNALKDDCDGLERQILIAELNLEKKLLRQYVKKIQVEINRNLARIDNQSTNDNKIKQYKKAQKIEDEVKEVLEKDCPDFGKNDIDDAEVQVDYDAIYAEVEGMLSNKLKDGDTSMNTIKQCSNLCVKYNVSDQEADKFDKMLVYVDEKRLKALPNIDQIIQRLGSIQRLIEMEQDEQLREKIFQKQIKRFLNEFV